MPGGDKRGPLGQGPITGRKAGYCTGHHSPGFTKQGGNAYGGRGFLSGTGRRMGNRNIYRETGQPGWRRNNITQFKQTDNDNKNHLKDWIESLKTELNEMNSVLETIEKSRASIEEDNKE
ncbi:DUF5320 domain-containing protein [Spirochaetota bacterium]